MKAIVLLVILIINFLIFPLHAYTPEFKLSPDVNYIFVVNNLIGELYNNSQLILTNLSGDTIEIPVIGLLKFYSYSHYLIVVELTSAIVFPNLTVVEPKEIVYLINTLTMKYYNITLKAQPSIDGIYEYNVTSEIISNVTKAIDGYVLKIPTVNITIHEQNLITNTTTTISFTTTGLPLEFEKGNETFIGKSYAVLNPDNNHLYIITGTDKLQYAINIVNLTSSKITLVLSESL